MILRLRQILIRQKCCQPTVCLQYKSAQVLDYQDLGEDIIGMMMSDDDRNSYISAERVAD